MDANEQTKSETDNHAKDRAELDTEIQRLGLDEETAGPTTVAYEFPSNVMKRPRAPGSVAPTFNCR